MIMSWLKKSRGSQGRTGQDRRRSDRLGTNSLSCDLGTVVDISQTGMKLRSDRKPPVRVGQVFEAKLDSGTHRVPVSGQVIWVKRRSMKSYEMGVKFVNIKASLKAAIESIGMYGFVDLDRAAQAKKRKYSGSSGGQRQTVRATADLPDYYKMLELGHSASNRDIKLAFRNLARKFHPDVSPSEEASRKFIEITQAYEVLRDPDAKKSYDRRRAG